VIYPTEEAAFLRAEAIRLRGKWWPGVIRHRDGTFELTYNPLNEVAPDLPAGRDMGSEGRQGGRAQRAPDASPRREQFEKSPTKVIMAGMERVL
jgi:hypothetical protein